MESCASSGCELPQVCARILGEAYVCEIMDNTISPIGTML